VVDNAEFVGVKKEFVEMIPRQFGRPMLGAANTDPEPADERGDTHASDTEPLLARWRK
jgi:hypothetical protein